MKFGLRMVRLRQRLKKERASRAIPPADLDPKQIFASGTFSDIWEDAQMPEVLAYLRGNKSLQIPADWRELLPTAL